MDIATYILQKIDLASATYIQDSFIALAGYFGSIAADLLVLSIIGLMILWLKRLVTPDYGETAWFFIKAVAIISIAQNYGLYSWLVDLFTQAPGEVAGSLLSGLGGHDIKSTNELLGQFIETGFESAGNAAAGFSWGIGYITGFIILIGTIVCAIGLLFIIGMSKIMLSILLGFGPMFLFFMLFKSTGRMTEMWLQQISNYALLPLFAYSISIVTLPLANEALNDPDIASKFQMSGVFLLLAFFNVLALKQVSTLVSGITGGLALSDEYRTRRSMGMSSSNAQRASGALINKMKGLRKNSIQPL